MKSLQLSCCVYPGSTLLAESLSVGDVWIECVEGHTALGGGQATGVHLSKESQEQLYAFLGRVLGYSPEDN